MTTQHAARLRDVRHDERGSATVIAILIMGLLTIFVSLALSRVSSEALVMSNDAAENRATYAAQASLETMTHNFNKIFDIKLNPTTQDIYNVKYGAVPGQTGYTFNQNIIATTTPSQVVVTGGEFDGLNATRDAWQLTTTATDANGVAVQLMRTFFNNRVPIFQFGIFYDDDLEFHPGPVFNFGGRVHSNGNIFLMAGSGLYFSSRVTASGEVVPEVARNGESYSNWGENVFIKNASGTNVQLKHDMGSVRNGPNINNTKPGWPAGTVNSNWANNAKLFDGNLTAHAKELNLPLRLGGAKDYIELIRRGRDVGDLFYNSITGAVEAVTAGNADNATLSTERYANKPGIRISLADSRTRLPGCANVAAGTPCGVRLDGASDGLGAVADTTGFVGSRGYKPRPMTDGYQATRMNGHRLYTGVSYTDWGSPALRQTWIKIELVTVNNLTGLPQAQDITQDFLSLGLTERVAVNDQNTVQVQSAGYYNTNGPDTRAIIKMQRYVMDGPALTSGASIYYTNLATSPGYNVVKTENVATAQGESLLVTDFVRDAKFNKLLTKIIPFPIEMFDTREGLYNDDITQSNIPWSGVMSVIDIDVANFRRFINGTFDGLFPNGTPYATATGQTLRSTAVPNNNGWIMYISDRRGNRKFDGEYGMEDIYGNNDGVLQPGEDVNRNGVLDVNYTWEATKYTANATYINALAPLITNTTVTLTATTTPDLAAVFDHRFYRRGVRLINGSRLPESLTNGFTLASENGVYVKGDYNATSVTNSSGLSQPSNYTPYNVAGQVPSSVVGDAVTILSNAWSDANSFRNPFTLSSRVATQTTVRTAIMAGDTVGSLEATPNQGGGDPNMVGGVHNFKRFLENWGSTRLNYCGSLINLYNSRNNNGAFKCCAKVYSPPERNWIFDTSFLDPTRLPPGTPQFQFIQITGFQRVNY